MAVSETSCGDPNLFDEHSFKESFGETIICFKALKMKDSLFLWIGDSSNFDALTIATPNRMSTVPSCTTVMGNDFNNLHTAITQRLAKRLKKQILLSLNINLPDEDIITWIEKRVIKECERFPGKF